MNVFYFGVWDQPGHFWHEPRGGRVWDTSVHVPFAAGIDGGFAPRRWRSNRYMNRGLVKSPECCFEMERSFTQAQIAAIHGDTKEYAQGEFLLHHRNEWTLMSWWDRSQGDKRPGCNSNIVAEGILPSHEMYDLLVEHFSSVAENLVNAGITLREVTPR